MSTFSILFVLLKLSKFLNSAWYVKILQITYRVTQNHSQELSSKSVNCLMVFFHCVVQFPIELHLIY